jgi:hypothetical protein
MKQYTATNDRSFKKISGFIIGNGNDAHDISRLPFSLEEFEFSLE